MRVGDHKLGLLPIEGQEKLIMNIGNEHFERIKDISLNQFEEEDRDQLIAVLGLNAQNRFYRYLLLSTISQLWRDYLTEVEGLRVAVKMEAYGQRDPLVAYKSRASQLFSDLLANIRSNVVQHMFHVRLINDEDLRKIRPGLQMGASEDQSSRKAGATSGKRKKKSRKRH